MRRRQDQADDAGAMANPRPSWLGAAANIPILQVHLMSAELTATPPSLRRVVKSSWDSREIGRLLALAAVHDGMSRGGAAQIVGAARQTLRGLGRHASWRKDPRGPAIACFWAVDAA